VIDLRIKDSGNDEQHAIDPGGDHITYYYSEKKEFYNSLVSHTSFTSFVLPTNTKEKPTSSCALPILYRIGGSYKQQL
jgi:hypothetical protein